VIIDFVPNHVSREYHSTAHPRGVVDLGANDNPDWAFSPLNNFYYMPGQKFAPYFDIKGYEEYPARATGNDCFVATPSVNDWYETVKLNYGVFYQGGGEKQFEPIPDTWHKMLHILLFWASKQVDGFRCDMAVINK
jgi:glycosidase